MWLYLSDAFLSIVAHQEEPDSLLVRARCAGDIERVFPHAKVWRTPTADYLYRAVISRTAVAAALAIAARCIEYRNFKSSVVGNDRHRVYYGAYNATLALDGEPRTMAKMPKQRRKR